MRRLTLEERVSRLEKFLEKSAQKNEFLGFGKPRRADEPKFIKNLFGKYPTLDKALHQAERPVTGKDSLPFHLVLSTDEKYNNVSFIISGPDRDNMYCTAFNKNNLEIDKLKPFSLDKDVNKIARFLLEILRNNSKNESKSRKLEAVSLSGLDCESLRQDVESELTAKDIDVTIEADTDNADEGLVILSMYNPDWVAEYSVTMDDTASCTIECDNKEVGVADSIEDAVEMIADHFEKNYVD